MIESYVLLGTLGVHSLEDLKQKKITVTFTLFSGILGVFLHLLFQNKSIFDMLIGMIPGVFILLVSILTKGGIGMGDAMVFMLTGLYLGWKENVFLLLLSFFLAGIWGFFCLLTGHGKKTDRIPLVPFLFLGYGWMVML